MKQYTSHIALRKKQNILMIIKINKRYFFNLNKKLTWALRLITFP